MPPPASLLVSNPGESMPKNVSPSAITIQAPATLANLGPGFDSFGMAVSVFNQFRFTPAKQDSIRLEGTDTGKITLSPTDNLVFQALDYLYQQAGKPRQAQAESPAFALSIEAPIPLARGMGSSSTAIAAGLMAANHFLNTPYSLAELCRFATILEHHPDNVVPTLRGGVWLCDAEQSYPLPWPDAWTVILVIPPYPIQTEDARQVMPEHLSRQDAVYNLRKASLLTYALLNQDPQALSDALSDRIHQPYRSQLIPEFSQLVPIARQIGALGTVISGSGSTMAVFCETKYQTVILADLKQQSFLSACQIMSPSVSTQGAFIQPDI